MGSDTEDMGVGFRSAEAVDLLGVVQGCLERVKRRGPRDPSYLGIHEAQRASQRLLDPSPRCHTTGVSLSQRRCGWAEGAELVAKRLHLWLLIAGTR